MIPKPESNQNVDTISTFYKNGCTCIIATYANGQCGWSVRKGNKQKWGFSMDKDEANIDVEYAVDKLEADK